MPPVAPGPRRRLRSDQEPFLVARCLASDYSPGFVIDTHHHEWHQLLYATTGAMTVTCPGATWIVPPGRAVWIPAHARHAIRMWGTVAMRSMYFRPDTGLETKTCKVISVTPLLRELILRSVELAGLDTRELVEQHVAALVLDEVQRAKDGPLLLPMPSDERARKAAEAVLRDPSQKPVAGEIARSVGLSERTLERLFSAGTGMSFGVWRQKARLLASLRVLVDTQSVTEAALESGYSSASAYIAAFRQTFGYPPGSLTD
ncbi:MAG: helix-turn-helix transcriptional regulator [Bryobacteraceae bacterium]|nr:helix-turn-helix transcriptional regulator [Bryobacteraceae bacterium]